MRGGWRKEEEEEEEADAESDAEEDDEEEEAAADEEGEGGATRAARGEAIMGGGREWQLLFCAEPQHGELEEHTDQTKTASQ